MIPLLAGLAVLLGAAALAERVRARRRLLEAERTSCAISNELQAKIRELEASRNQIEGILEGMAEGVLVIGPGEKLLLVNESARQILGMGRSAQAGVPLSEATRYPSLRELVRRVLREGKEHLEELELYAPQARVLRVHVVPCQVPLSGQCALLVFHDITELKRLEKVRQEFVANVSHELKTPLTTLQAAAETLLDGAMSDPEHSRSFLAAIQEETVRLRRLVEDLLSLAQVESKTSDLQKQPIPLGPFLEELAARYRPLAEAQEVTLSLEPPAPALQVQADRDHLAQAVGNLLDNALKYNRPGGKVWLRAASSDRTVTLEVEDTGIGIPEGDLPRVFERFYRVDKARSRETGGTGLGLAIVKHVVESHDGSVRAESALGRGSRFFLTLPP